MVPDKFNMVDMGGIDLILMQGEEVEGLYDKLVESITQCRYQCLYNWYFDDVLIPPTYVSMSIEENSVVINSGITVDSDDIIHIYSLSYPPVIVSLFVTENGDYEVPEGVDGFNPVSVEVPGPVIQSLQVLENGVYSVPEGVDGYNPVTVETPVPVIQSLSVVENGVYSVSTGIDGYNPVTVNVPIQYEPVNPDFFGLATAYQDLSGNFRTSPIKNMCLFIAPIESDATYVVMLPATVGNRFRVGRWSGKSYEDFEPYLDDPAAETTIYSGATMVTGNSELSGDGLTRRFFFSGVDGSVVVGTSNNSQLIYRILLKVNS